MTNSDEKHLHRLALSPGGFTCTNCGHEGSEDTDWKDSCPGLPGAADKSSGVSVQVQEPTHYATETDAQLRHGKTMCCEYIEDQDPTGSCHVQSTSRWDLVDCEKCLASKPRPIDAPLDAVNNPKHYNLPGLDVTAIDVIESVLLNSVDFQLGNALKYLIRAGKKGDPATEAEVLELKIEDLDKASWYLKRATDILKKSIL